MAIKENSADVLQRERLLREKALAPHSRICDIITAVLFCLFIGGFALLHIFMPDKEYSERENRVLETLPKLSADSLFSGEYTSNMTEYLSDQFPMRDFFVSVKASSERISLRMENGGIMFGKNCLTARMDHPDTENLDINMTSADGFCAALENKGINTVFAIAGRRADVCTNDLPTGYGESSQNKLWSLINGHGSSFSGEYVNLRDILRDADSVGEKVYYRTDHHWTTLGAYYAYKNIWSSLPESLTKNLTVRSAEDFTVECVTEEFFGTSYSSAGASWITPDKIDLYRFEGDDTIPVTIADTGETLQGLYRFEYLEKRDKYSIFLGENAGRVDIGKGDRPCIMIIKDSFAQSLVPFLAADFDIVMIDPRYFSGSIYRLSQEISPDAVLILMNADTLTTSPVLRPLMRGVD